jgi:glycosyltransferase involved in cell wall biosynthesis
MILVVSHEASLTGAPKSLLDVCSHFKKKNNYEFFFILNKDGVLLDEYKKLGEVFIWQPARSNKSLTQRLWNRLSLKERRRKNSLAKKIASFNINLIYFNTVAHPTDLIKYLIKFKIPIITHVRESLSVIRNLNKENQVLELLSHSDKCITVSKYTAEVIISEFNINPTKIEVIHNGIEQYNPLKDLTFDKQEPHEFTIVGCGSIIYRKGVDLFILAANKLQKMSLDKKINFVWIGGDVNSYYGIELKTEIEKLGLSDTIKMVGEVTDPTLYYGTAKLFLNTTREEAFGKVLLETSQYGLPIIAFKNSGFPEEFIVDGVNGYLVDYCDVDSASERIIELINDFEKYSILSKGSLKRVQDFDINNTTNSIEKLFCKYLTSAS